MAIELENFEIAKILLSNTNIDIDVNIYNRIFYKYILIKCTLNIFIGFNVKLCNTILYIVFNEI